LSSIEEKTDSTEDKVAVVLAARGVGWIIGSIIAGKAYELIKGNRILWIVLLVTAGLNFLIPLISNIWVLAALTAICGAFMSPIEVGVNTLTIWIWKEDVGPYMQLLHFAYGAGMGCSPLLFGIVVKIVPTSIVLGTFFWMVGIIVALIAIPVFKLKSPPPEREYTEAQAHTHHGPTDEPMSTMDLMEEERVARSNKIRFFIVVPLVAGFLLLYGGAENTYSVWVAPYAEEVYQLGKDDAAFVDAIFFAMLTVGRFISVPLATRLSSRILLLSAMLVCITSLVVGLMFEALILLHCCISWLVLQDYLWLLCLLQRLRYLLSFA
jgi:predicted MFS family arabinose efflux permease